MKDIKHQLLGDITWALRQSNLKTELLIDIPAEGVADVSVGLVGGAHCGESVTSAAVTSTFSCTHKGQERTAHKHACKDNVLLNLEISTSHEFYYENEYLAFRVCSLWIVNIHSKDCIANLWIE